MKSQRGSVTVIAVVMLLFLMTVAIAWLPMMTMEKTAASSDYREQQAWYAAEAGYKRAVAALENKNSNWWWITQEKSIQSSDSTSFGHLSLDGNKVDQEKIWYAVGIMKDGLDISSTYTPEDNVAYQITSIGSCQGSRKVIRKVYTLGDNGETGGVEEGRGEEVLDLPGLIQAGGKITFANDGTGAVDGDIYVSDSEKVEDKTHGGQGGLADGKINVDKGFVHGLKTLIPDSVFKESNYDDIQEVSVSDKWEAIKLDSNTNYLINWPLPDTWGYKIDGTKANGSVLFIHSNKPIKLKTTDGISGPDSGKPLTVVFDNEVEVDGPVSGNIRFLAKKDFVFGSGSGSAAEVLFMIMSNNDISIRRPIKYGFLSAHRNVDLTLKQEFYGQIQAHGDVYVASPVHYSDNVLKAPGFTVPKGMK